MTSPIIQNQNNVAVSATPTLIGTMSAGSLILNNSSTDAVFVSPYSNLSPATGLRIGPLGSVSWSQTSPLWAISESGNPVSITVSSAATNPSDPLTVAEALVTQGVPSTILSTDYGSFDTLSNITINNPTLAQASMLYLTTTSVNEESYVDIKWLSDSGSTIKEYVCALPTEGTITIPVVSSHVIIKGLTSVHLRCTIKTTNQDSKYTYFEVPFLAPIPVVGTVNSGTQSISNTTAFGMGISSAGLSTIHVTVNYQTATVTPWTLQYESDGTPNLYDFISSGEQVKYNGNIYTLNKLITMPAMPVYVRFKFASTPPATALVSINWLSSSGV